jgi:hypothetical protein
MRVAGQRQAPAALPLGKRPGTHYTGGWMGVERLVFTGIRSQDRPVRSESLYRLRYAGSDTFIVCRVTNYVLLQMFLAT